MTFFQLLPTSSQLSFVIISIIKLPVLLGTSLIFFNLKIPFKAGSRKSKEEGFAGNQENLHKQSSTVLEAVTDNDTQM